MKEILQILPKPSRYIGIEEGSRRVSSEDILEAKIHICLAFPDLYEIGMSYLGQKIMYGIINEVDGYIGERVFSPCADAGKILQENKVLLSSLESDTDLNKFHIIGFSLTHELAFTNILYMLELGGIPLLQKDRNEDLKEYPLVIIGGGCTINAEPIADFVDIMVIGEGEATFMLFLEVYERARKENWTKTQLFEKAMAIQGIYIPSFFEVQNNSLEPKYPQYTTVYRALVTDIDTATYPVTQISPFGAVHNRLSLEIARGCTRGCRFCQAGFTTRPSRERSIENIKELLEDSLKTTGYEEVSFLSLSAGDFSALKTLFVEVYDKCAGEQVSLSLPSLRVGSIDGDIMEKIASIRRTGATLAPEAGSQRLRNVINKGITEEALIHHVQQLQYYGWQQVKLYFMIGLPTETEEDLKAIIDLAVKVRDCGIYFDENGRKQGSKCQVTVAVSPFVPKTHTPFQWEAQISLEEMTRRIYYLRSLAKAQKNITLRWHEASMSFVEGILSRGDRKLGNVVYNAYKKGAIFASWIDQFNPDMWVQTMKEAGLSIEEYTGKRDINLSLPWDHLHSGLDKKFLLKEREKALKEEITLDCRYEGCSLCGVCDFPKKASTLRTDSESRLIKTKLNFPKRDQIAVNIDEQPIKRPEPKEPVSKTNPPKIDAHLTKRVIRYKVWHKKVGMAAYLSQLEVQPLLERALRRGKIEMSFSQGFHPLPLLTFGRALPVAVESNAEWFALTLRKPMEPTAFLENLKTYMPLEMEPYSVEILPLTGTIPLAMEEVFKISFPEVFYEKIKDNFEKSLSQQEIIYEKLNKKQNLISTNIKEMILKGEWFNKSLHLKVDYSTYYLSPIILANTLLNTPQILPSHQIKILKLIQ